MATTTNYGFEIPDDTDLVKDGALAMRDLGQDVDTAMFTALGGEKAGLILLNHQTFTSVASVSIGSDASPLFLATYNNYKILLNATNASSSNISFRVRANTTDESGSVYEQAIFNITNGAQSGIVVTSTEMLVTAGSGATAKAAVIDLLNPLAASPTFYSGFGMNNTASNINSKVFTGVVDNSTAYNGISFLAGSGNMSGSISVYGYNL
jgi:hypothetical protein